MNILPKFRAVLFGLILLSLTLLSHQRNAVWDSGVSLWSSEIARNPISFRAQYALGDEFFDRGDLVRAEQHYLRALALRPAFPQLHHNLGIVYVKQGRYQDAIRELRLAIAGDPGNADAHYDIGLAYERDGDGKAARDEYQHALRLRPDHAKALIALYSLR